MKSMKYEKTIKTGALAVSIFLCLMTTSGNLIAKTLNQQEIRPAIETWVRYITADARPDAVIEEMDPYMVNGIPLAYIAHLSDSGFCICGADDRHLPVYLYSPGGTYDPDNEVYRYFLNDMAQWINKIDKAQKNNDPDIRKYAAALDDRSHYWSDLAGGKIPQKERGLYEGPDQMGLDMTSVWHQWSPYNDYCPELTPGWDELCAIGCVAGTMAAIMRYWEWPVTGVGTGSTIYHRRWRNNWDEEPLVFDPGIPPGAVSPAIPTGWVDRLEWTAADGGKLRMNGYWDGSLYFTASEINANPNYLNALEALYNRLTQVNTPYSADFGSTTYQWDLIQDEHWDPPDAGAWAVALLCYQAGVSASMGYGVTGSGAGVAPSISGYVNNFRYDGDMEYVVRDTGNYAAGVNDMMDDIQWLRPVQYWGWEHGHSWVIFGYNRTFLPDSIQWAMNSVNGSIDWLIFNPIFANHCFMRYIAPESVVRFVGSAASGDGSPADPYMNIEAAIGAATPDGATLIFKAGSDNTFSTAPLVIDRPFILKGKNAVIRKD
jgi:hypothetical protein